MGSVFWVDSDSSSSSSSISSSSSSSNSDREDGSSSWKQIKSNAGKIAILPHSTVPFYSPIKLSQPQDAKRTAAVAQDFCTLSIDRLSERMTRLNKAKFSRQRLQIADTVEKLHVANPNARDAQLLESPLLCLANSTRSSLAQHVQVLRTFYNACHAKIGDPLSTATTTVISTSKAFVDVFCTASERTKTQLTLGTLPPLHSVYNLHGPPSAGKTSWVINFWEGRLGIPTRIWDLYASPSTSITDLCSSIASFFAQAVLDTNVHDFWNQKDDGNDATAASSTLLVPCLVRNLDHVLDVLDVTSQKIFCNTLVKLLMEYACASSEQGNRQQFAIVYLSTSSKSTYEQRDLLKRLGLYHDGRIIKFAQPDVHTKIEYLNNLALEGYAKPSVIPFQCPSLSAFLGKSWHRLDQPAGKISISSLVSNTLFVQHYCPGSMPSWLSSCDAQLVWHKNNKRAVLTKSLVAETSLAVVASQDAQVLLSVLIWPQVFGVSRAIHASLFARTTSHYGLRKCALQISKNAFFNPCREALVSEWMPPTRLSSASVDATSLGKCKYRVVKMLEQLLITDLGAPSEQGKYPHTNSMLAALIQTGGGKTSTPTTTMHALDSAITCLVALLWLTSPQKRVYNQQPMIKWQEEKPAKN